MYHLVAMGDAHGMKESSDKAGYRKARTVYRRISNILVMMPDCDIVERIPHVEMLNRSTQVDLGSCSLAMVQSVDSERAVDAPDTGEESEEAHSRHFRNRISASALGNKADSWSRAQSVSANEGGDMVVRPTLWKNVTILQLLKSFRSNSVMSTSSITRGRAQCSEAAYHSTILIAQSGFLVEVVLRWIDKVKLRLDDLDKDCLRRPKGRLSNFLAIQLTDVIATCHIEPREREIPKMEI